MIKILANDGIDPTGKSMLEAAGFFVETQNIPQDQLPEALKNFDAITVRSATKVRKDLIDSCPNLRLIGRGGVGMDNIDVEYAENKGIHIINTPTSSSDSVAELVFAHLLTGVRFLHDSNRNMPLEGDTNFNTLKKAYANGIELRGKTLGIIGMGRIGEATAKMAIGLGMKVVYNDTDIPKKDITIPFFNGQSISISLISQTLESLFQESDFISLHVPAQDTYVIGEKELDMMKDGVGIVNCARGGAIDEVALIKALDDDKIAFAGLDVFESEPHPEITILMHPKISLTPHIGAATIEAQERIGIELAQQIISYYDKSLVK